MAAYVQQRLEIFWKINLYQIVVIQNNILD